MNLSVPLATLIWALVTLQGEDVVDHRIGAMPQGYRLQVFEDCGSLERQPHVLGQNIHTYDPSQCNADDKARSVSWDWKAVEAIFDDMDPRVEYVLAVTYANEPFNDRIQSLWAGPTLLHGPHALPKGGMERLLFRLPPESIQEGKLHLRFTLEGPVNVVVSAIELWSPAPSPKVLHLTEISGLFSDLEGRALDLAYDPAPAVTVTLKRSGFSDTLGSTQTDSEGRFKFERRLFETSGSEDLDLVATRDDITISQKIQGKDLHFEPVRYHPIPSRTSRLRKNVLSLDGIWKICPKPEGPRTGVPLEDASWQELTIPGQWVQQGFDVAKDQKVAMARAFKVPKTWAGHRIFLRFEAIHAGTQYVFNGTPLGYSETLYTPVEWDVSSLVQPGQVNRLDLEMQVDTVSERLSYSSGYAFHNLGGIDRSVRLVALPPVHVRDLRILTDLDAAYQDADLSLELTVEKPANESISRLEMTLSLTGPDRKTVPHSVPSLSLDSSDQGPQTVRWTTHVPNPLKWNAEKPTLYHMVLELNQDGQVVERIERNIGFRKIEIRDKQILVNGVPVKLAGACHHEIDPLTGRANTSVHAEKDVQLMKGCHMNILRTSHYPPCQEFLDAADRLGMYVEVEAPFCWVGNEDLSSLKAILTPTSAMIDECHAHPSVILWSLANESFFSRPFELSNVLVKDLDPTRPTTFNNPDPKRICDIGNLHYPPMPYDDSVKGETRPMLLGEYFFPVCHEQTDVRINPGLRELWGHGHSDPSSEWGQSCAQEYDKPFLLPGGRPGAWSHLYRSETLIGGHIWAAIDEPFYLPGGKHAGYAWVHGFWGLIDAWRRPKPEWWLARMIYNPVWFPCRHIPFRPGQATVKIPVENRYSFTDLGELTWTWTLAGHSGRIPAAVLPSSTGQIEIPVPEEAEEGDVLDVTVKDDRGALVNEFSTPLGKPSEKPLPAPCAGPLAFREEGEMLILNGDPFSWVINKSSGSFLTEDLRNKSPLLSLPSLHVTRFDFGDLQPSQPRYEALPDEKTRELKGVTVRETPQGTELIVEETFNMFSGSVSWLIDKQGAGVLKYDYTYSGPDLEAREIGMKMLLRSECDELQWDRWSEWGDVFPEDQILRTRGVARARRDPKSEEDPEGIRPDWPWSLDQTTLGTSDFRGVKFNITEAGLWDKDGRGISIYAHADAHVRACLSDRGVWLHMLSDCHMGPRKIKAGDHITGQFVVRVR